MKSLFRAEIFDAEIWQASKISPKVTKDYIKMSCLDGLLWEVEEGVYKLNIKVWLCFTMSGKVKATSRECS